MKRRFLLICLFAMSIIGNLQASSTPTVSRAYADQFVTQVESTQIIGAAGVINATFGVNGNINLSSIGTNSKVVAIQVLVDGTFLVLLCDSSNSYIAKFTENGVLNTNFGSGTGIYTLSGYTNDLNDLSMIVDEQNRILVTGLHAGNPSIARILANGSAIDSSFTFTAGASWSGGAISALAFQATGEIIAIGSGSSPQVARYNFNGSIDTTFGINGYAIFNGSNDQNSHAYPNTSNRLSALFIDANNNLYIPYLDGSNNAQIIRLTSSGNVDTSWGTSGIVALAYLNGVSSSTIRIAIDLNNNLVIAASITSGNMLITSIAESTGGAASPAFTNTTITGNFTLYSLITTNNGTTGKILLTGNNQANNTFRVTRLNNTGGLDTTFNAPQGYNQFGSSVQTPYLTGSSLSPNGSLYVCGYTQSGVPNPTGYVYSLYDEPYAVQIPRFPADAAQGVPNLSFGSTTTEVYPGVVSPFNGLYGPSLLQQPQAAIEITTGSNPTPGDILIGMNGYTNTSASSNMMFAWLTSAGVLDTAVGNSGYLTLQNLYSNEYLTSLTQGQSGVVYLAGYASATPGGASTRAILRAYAAPFTSSTAIWAVSETTAGYEGISAGLQGFTNSQEILFFVSETATSTGHISRYLNNGSLDTTFGNAGYVYHNAFAGVNMGPCYGNIVDNFDNIYAAFVDATSHEVTVAAITPSGTALLTGSFGAPNGYVTGLFGGTTTVNPNNIRICFDKNGDIIVAVVDSATPTELQITCLSILSGQPVPTFNGGNPLLISIAGTTSLQLEQITGVSDGTVLATFWDSASPADDTMYVVRIIATGGSAGTVDTSFNAQASQPGVLPIKVGDKVPDYNARVVTAGLVQSIVGANQGNIVIAGYESVTTNDSTPMIMSVYGDPGSTEIPYYPAGTVANPGTFEAAYDLDSLFGIVGAGTSIFVYPSSNAYQGLVLIGIDTGSSSKIIRMNVTGQTLDTSFGTSGIYTVNQGGVNTISIDATNNVVIGGTTSGGVVWAQQLSPNGGSPVSFTMPTNLTAIHGIYQQESGRYIVAASGTQNNPVSATQVGVLVAFQDKLVSPSTTLVVDPTFNPLGTGAVTAGQCSVDLTVGLYALAINNNTAHNPDTIAVAYAVGGGAVKLGVFTADGSGFSSTTFNTGGGGAPITTNISADSSAVVQLNIDASGNMIVAASGGSGTQVQAQRYSSAGVEDTTFNGNAGIITISNLGTSGVTLTNILETTTNQTILVGYNSAGGNGPLFAVRLDSTGALDSTWNPNPSGTDTAGVLTYSADSATQMNSAGIALFNGTLLSIGSTAGGTSGDPILTLVYGNPFVIQASQYPFESPAGTLDLTIPNGNSGALPLATLPAGGAVSGVPQRLYIYNSTINNSPNGAMLIASTSASGATLYVTQLNADLSLNTNFGSGSGVLTLTPNAASSPTSITVSSMYVANGTNDTTQPIYIAGYTTASGVNTPFGVQVTSNGSSGAYVSPASAFAGATGVTGSIRQSTNSRIFMSGFNGSNGAVVAYNSALNAIDTSFGNNADTASAGYYTSTGTNPIYSMTTDNSDRIYIAYQTSSTTILVQRLLENGTALDTTFGTAGTFTITGTNLSITQIRMAIDLTNNQLVVAAQDGNTSGNILRVNRYNFATNAATGSISTITITGAILNLSDLFIDNDQNIYVIGYTATGNSIVARVKSTSSTTIALDTSYAAASSPAGVANLAAGSMSKVTAAALDQDRRVYLVGSNGSTTAYMGRFFGDYYWTEIYPAILQALVGTIDLTLNPNFTGGLVLSSQTGWSSLANYSARAIIENPNGDGTSFIAFGHNASLIVGKLNADMVPVTAFGGNGNGLTNSVIMANVNSIAIDAFENIIVSGIHSGAQDVVSFTSAGILNATFATPTLASTVGTKVGQQKSGRYIVAGYDGSANGLISAYQNESAISAGTLSVDLTFGPAADNGYYPTGVNAQIDDFVIDSNDDIYFVYRGISPNANVVFLGKLTANGSGLVNSQNSPNAFNSGLILNTGIVATQPAHIAINNAGNILVGASTNSGTANVTVALFNGITGSQIHAPLSVVATNTPVLTQLVGSSSEFYGVVYGATPQAVLFAITSAGALDTNFGTSGLLTTTVESPTQLNGLSVQYDGKIVAVGKNASNPILLRGYGYPYVAQYAQAPDQIAAGILDTTLWPITGAFALNNTTNSTFNSLIHTYTVKRVYESGNGVMLFVADQGNNTIVFRLLKDLTLDTSFNGTGYRQFTSFYGGTTGLFVNSTGNIFVTGNHGGVGRSIGMTSSGANLSPNFNPSAFLATSNQISQQSGGRIIIGGQGSLARGQANTDGYLLAYTTSGALDASFAVGGQLDMTVTTAITDITIDQNDNIIAVSNNSGTVVLQKVNPSGTVITTSSGTQITGASGNIKVAIDANGYIVVAALTSSGYSLRSYNNDSTLSNNAGPVTCNPSFTTPILSNIFATTDTDSTSKIFMVGYDSAVSGSTAGDVIVARLTSGAGILSLDTSSFNAAGTSPSAPGYVVASLGGTMNQFFDATIHADDRVMVVGGSTTSANPYMGRVFGDDYYTYVSQGGTTGVAGTLNTSFGTNGIFNISTLSGVTSNSKGEAIVALPNGGYYLALQNASNTQLIRTVASGALDTTYGGGTGIATSTAPLGVNSMLKDGSGRILLVGTTGGAGWVQRYVAGNSGAIDTTFGTNGQVAPGTVATVAVEQTLARLVVAGANSSGNGALFAYTSLDPYTVTTGAVDTTFGSGTGTVTTGVAGSIYTLIADQYDRLIFASLNAAGNAVDLYRLTPTGEFDITFGTNGKVAGVIANANSASQIRVALNLAGNIVIAASTTSGIAVVSYDNGTSTTAGANGAIVNAQYTITTFASPTLTGLVNTSDGYTLVLGNQLGLSTSTSPVWVARLILNGTSAIALDTTGFNPNGLIFNQSSPTSGGTAGIFEYYNATLGTNSPYNVYNAFTVNANGSLGLLGYEVNGATNIPTLISVVDGQYILQEVQSPDSQPVGTNDHTLGVSQLYPNAIAFYGGTGDISSGQAAQAIGLYDDNNFVVALNGNATAGAGANDIMINMFDTDGIANPNFGTAGSATVLTTYQNQFVNDMVTFTTATGVQKAIIAGYVTNTVLGTSDSLLLQYILTPGSQTIDTSFGGYNGNPQGIAFGDGQNAFVVGRQTLGRIIVGGMTQDTTPLGLLLGYNSSGNLDTTFGNDGYVSISGTSGIYTHAIDSDNRIVIAYVDGSGNGYVARFLADGSALDASFNGGSPILFTAGVVGHNIKVAVDNSNNVVVAAVISSGNNIILHSYSAANGSSISTATFTNRSLGGAGISYYTIARLLVDLDNKVVVVATDLFENEILVARMIASGSAYVLDNRTNDSNSPFNGIYGYNNYSSEVNSTSLSTNAFIHPDGRIIVVGSSDS